MPITELAGSRLGRRAGRAAPATWAVRDVAGAVDGSRVYRELFGSEPTAFWLDSSLAGDGRMSVLGTSAGPGAEVLSWRVGDDTDVFAELDRRLARRRADLGDPPAALGGVFCGGYVGFFGYEAKALTGGDAAHVSPTPDALWIWADRFVVIDHVRDRTLMVAIHAPADRAAAEAWLDRAAAAAGRAGRRPADPVGASEPPPVAALDVEGNLEQSRAAYLAGIEHCLGALRDGLTYEVCLTNRVRLPPEPDPLSFYLWQRARNPAPYAAFVRVPGLAVASSSPERFLGVDADGWAECRPIKGTAARSADPYADRLAAARLASDEKTRAENLMIVDLIRNDLGRVSRPGTVRVPRLMAVESYATVHQLVTTVRGRLRPGLTALDAVRACFPPGSMTGAPKIGTMRILDGLEDSARGVYSGALGWLGVDGRADLSVVIRTAVMTPEATVIGAGGAIVLDSDPESEFEEMLLKATATLRGRG